jgi:hypothetical protein
MPIHNPDHSVAAQPFFEPNILDGGVDQLQQHVFLVGFGVRTIGFPPRQSLGTGWLIRTIGTLIPLRPDTDIHLSAQNREMAQSDPLIVAVKLGNLPAAFAALRVF